VYAGDTKYKSGHSTETALVRVKNYIMMSIDQGKPVIHVFLDLSTAVDTVDHNIPLGKKTCLVCQVEYLNGLDPIWNNAPRECLFMYFI
jgi:hypothetical protein